MFSPRTKRSNFSTRKDRSVGGGPTDYPITPLQTFAEDRRPLQDTSIPNHPTTGTPVPWVSRLSTLARIPPAKKGEKAYGLDSIQPVYVGEYPQMVRNEQAAFLHKHVPGDASIFGGMDKGTCLAWVICGSKLFIWSYLSPAASRKCVVLNLPSTILESRDTSIDSYHANIWLLYVVNWDSKQKGEQRVVQQCNSAGVLLCNKKTRALAYWPDIYSEAVSTPVTSLASIDESEVTCSSVDAKIFPNKLWQHKRPGSSLGRSSYFNSLIASVISDTQNVCIALACSSNGEIWQFHCSPMGIERKKAYQDMLTLPFQCGEGNQCLGCKGYPRSLIWHFSHHSLDEPKRLFLLLTDHEIQCLAINLSSDFYVSKLWSHEIIGTDGDLGIQKDLAGQKRVWPLDLQIDSHGKVITVLIATFCKDRVSSSSYIQYSLLTMQYRTGINIPRESNDSIHERVLEKKAPVQVIIPKARVEDEDFLFSMRLRGGGMPSGSAVILSSDGTATVSHYWRNSTRLYQFDLPYDAGKVLDASVFPSDDGEDGAWAVLTEKAGVWAIPEKAVFLGGVEPPERSLSRKGSSNEGSTLDDHTFVGNWVPKRASSEAWDAGDRQRAGFTSIVHRTAQDEESETLLSHLFNDFLLSGKVDGTLDKFRSSGAFTRDGETNAFTRISKSIVDTLSKHWTTTRGAEIVALGVLSMQLMEKQQKHKKFLRFLALSKCHEELCSEQRESLHFIMEHGEKLAGMIQLRELQSMISQSRLSAVGFPSSSENEISGALWDLIQLVGDRARQNTVLLMDRDNAEVFYSKVSDLQEVFNCLERYLECVISEKMPFVVQLQRACELSNGCMTLVRTAMHYRNEHHMWYPSPEGLAPWYCQAVVRRGLWSVASFMLQLSNDMYCLDKSAKLDFYSHLEVLADVLLEAYSGAIRAKIELGEEHKTLLDEYWKKRDLLLDSLYQQVKGFYQAQYKDSSGTKEHNEEILGKVSSNLLSIAKRHESYQTLWNICSDLNDSELPKNLMRGSMGPKGGFSFFVFNQLYESKQLCKLMRLGEEFQEELATFLKHQPELCWLHEVFLHQFYSASETLHVLALSQCYSSILETEEQADTHRTSTRMTLADRKRLLNLSKIAAMAGKNADYDTKVKRIDADLKIMKLQEEILELLPDNKEKQEIGHRLLPPVDLIEWCLKSQNRKLALRAFDVFAWTSSSFLKCNTSLLEDCWRNAADQDDWERLFQRSMAEGWSDEDTFQVLRETILFQASRRCYGLEAEMFEGQFDEVLPLRQENLEVSTPKDILSSVDAILMGHKAFPDAGKLMLMATISGSIQEDTKMEEVPFPMG